MLLCIFLLKNNILRFISLFFLNDIKKTAFGGIMKLTRNQNTGAKAVLFLAPMRLGTSRREPLCYGYMIPQKS